MMAAASGARRRGTALVLAGLAGGLFGAGLIVSGMTQPARVIGFLDVTGAWDPSLAFVMASAVLICAVAFPWIQTRRSQPWFDTRFHVPPGGRAGVIDRPLIVGAALFGIGWGLGGLCPGPGIVAAASGSLPGLVFAAAMVAGMAAQHRSAR